jgi:hypothetical protein
MSVKSRSFEGEPRECAEYKYDQKNPMFRRAMKQLREQGWSRSSARPCAREMSRAANN